MSVEFVPDEPTVEGAEETVASRRARWPWALASLLVAAALVAAVVHRGPADRPVTEAAPSPTPTTAVATRPDPACAGVPDCTVRRDVSPAIRVLARDYLPAGAALQVRTVVGAGATAEHYGLVARDIDALVGSVHVVIRVQRGGPATAAIVPDPPGVGSLLLHERNAGFVVRLQYLAPATVAPMADRLQALLRTPALVSVP